MIFLYFMVLLCTGNTIAYEITGSEPSLVVELNLSLLKPFMTSLLNAIKTRSGRATGKEVVLRLEPLRKREEGAREPQDDRAAVGEEPFQITGLPLEPRVSIKLRPDGDKCLPANYSWCLPSDELITTHLCTTEEPITEAATCGPTRPPPELRHKFAWCNGYGDRMPVLPQPCQPVAHDDACYTTVFDPCKTSEPTSPSPETTTTEACTRCTEAALLRRSAPHPSGSFFFLPYGRRKKLVLKRVSGLWPTIRLHANSVDSKLLRR